MPAESIHLSALADLRASASSRVTRALATPRAELAARVGVMFVDLPYFHRFELGLVRYLLRLPQASSPWGDRFHQRAPIALGVRLAERGARLRSQTMTRDVGDELVALSVGYMSHAAVDTALHPLVNRLAVDRGARLHTRAFLREHQEVEKFQSVLFHEARHGVDYLGTPALAAHIAIDWRLVETPGLASSVIDEAAHATLGIAPRRADFAAWAHGYRFFVKMITGPLGRRAVSREDKARERPGLIEACDYPGRYAAAVARSVTWIDALLGYVDDGIFDDSARSALARTIPEQSLDPAPEPSPP